MLPHVIGVSILLVIATAAVGLLADAAIIYGIFRFKRLRTIPNIFLANWAIADIMSIVAMPLIIVIGYVNSGPGHEYSCLVIHSGVTLHLAAILFVILLSVDWCTAAYYHRTSEKLRKRYTIIIAAMWIAVLLFFSISASLCISQVHYYVSIILFIVFYVINCLLILAFQLSRIIQKFRTDPVSYPNLLTLRLNIVTVITSCYLLAVINISLVYFDVYAHSTLYVVVYTFVTLSIASVLCSSIITLGVLCRLDKDFKLSLFSRNDISHCILENDLSEVEDDTKNSSPVSYSNPIHAQSILPNSDNSVSS